MAEVIAISIALGLVGSGAVLAAWDGWKRYLVAIDRTAGLKALERRLEDRVAKLETQVAAQTRAIGIRAMAQAKSQQDQS